jgi:hypothetical protein
MSEILKFWAFLAVTSKINGVRDVTPCELVTVYGYLQVRTGREL